MRKRVLALAVLAATALLASGAAAQHSGCPPVLGEDGTVLVRMGMSAVERLQAVGPPEVVDGLQLHYPSRGFSLAIDARGVIGSFSARAWKGSGEERVRFGGSVMGVRLGDTREQVIARLGELASAPRPNPNGETLLHPDRWLVLELTDGVVTALTLARGCLRTGE